MPSQETDDVALVPENTVSEQSIVSEKRSEESDDVLLVQLDEAVTKSQEKGRKLMSSICAEQILEPNPRHFVRLRPSRNFSFPITKR